MLHTNIVEEKEFHSAQARTLKQLRDALVKSFGPMGSNTMIIRDNAFNKYSKDGKTILEAAFSVLNTSGKYREDGSYEGTSLGSFGIGSKITTFLSHWLEVETMRDSKIEKIWFKEGVFDKREIAGNRDAGLMHGTTVKWQPSEEFFKNTEVEIKKIRDLFKTISCLCPGLTINLDYNGTKEVYASTNGLNDLVDDAVKDSEIINNRLSLNTAEDKF